MDLPRGSRIFRRKIYEKTFMDGVEKLLREKLSDQQLHMLSLEDGKISLRDQLYIRYLDNRYATFLIEGEVLSPAAECIDKFGLLLKSGLDPSRIRHAFATALLDCISTGSGSYFLLWDFWYDKFWADNFKYRGDSKWASKRRKFWPSNRWTLSQIEKQMKKKYPQIPPTMHLFVPRRRVLTTKRWKYEAYQFSKQIALYYSYASILLFQRDKLRPESFAKDFFRRNKWRLERLSKCSSFFRHKYKDGICGDISLRLGMDTDQSYFRIVYFLKDAPLPSVDTNFLSRISWAIVGCFSPEELDLFKETDAGGDPWTLRHQIRDRYRSKYPSFADEGELMEHIGRKISAYRPLLSAATSEMIRELILDEIERECFVSGPTHRWNLEMDKHLKEGEFRCRRRVEKAIDLLISLLPADAVKQLEMSVDGRVFDLRQQLMARWSRARFGCSLKSFREYLSLLHIYTPYGFGGWESRETISRIDLQALLEELDMFFLYPQKGRLIKRIFSRLDNGRTVGMRNMVRVLMSLGNYEITYRFVCILLTIVVFVALLLLKNSSR